MTKILLSLFPKYSGVRGSAPVLHVKMSGGMF